MWLATDRVRPPAPPMHHAIADLGGGRRAQRQRIEIHPAERLHQAEAGHGIEAERMAVHHAAVADMQPDGFGLGDQIADGQHQPVIDQHAIAGALGAQGVGAEGVAGDDRMQADHRRQHAVEIETVVGRARLIRRRHLPFGQSGHGILLANRRARVPQI